jgi:hypothetical protein
VGIPVVVLCTADNQIAGVEWARRAGVPVVDARRPDARELAGEVGRALLVARPLPPIVNGAPTVARRLLELALARGARA